MICMSWGVPSCDIQILVFRGWFEGDVVPSSIQWDMFLPDNLTAASSKPP